MSHLLLMAIGPVQPFIAAARRSRDLWFGSHILAELSRAAARALAERGDLVFPALQKGASELEPCDGMVTQDGRAPLAIANKILVELEGDTTQAEEAARLAREAVSARWRALAGKARAAALALVAKDDDARWDEQVGSLLEIYVAWEPLNGSFVDARNALERRVAARKGLRNFKPFQQQPAGRPKSTLDGERDTVLARTRAQDLARKYKLSEGEQLDAVGVIKRCGGEPDAFVPLANIAARPWLKLADVRRKAALEALAQRLSTLKVPVPRRRIRDVDVPFDIEVLWEDRLGPFCKENQITADQIGDVVRDAANGGGPWPYVAALFADGDRVGAALDDLDSAEKQRAFSAELATFAVEARAIVERHDGELLYAGGDDVIAFLPVTQAIAAADALRRRFDALNLGGGKDKPTLSVGIGIAHVLGGLAELLNLARDAEKQAKAKHLPEAERGAALAVLLDKRSGDTHPWRCRWEHDPKGRIERAIAHAGLSHKKPYEVEAALSRLPDAVGNKAVTAAYATQAVEIAVAEVSLILSRSRRGEREDGVTPQDVGLDLSAKDWPTLRAAIEEWCVRHRIARALTLAAPPEAPSENA